jgi:L-alanine-DL-glutamate epimerase-like enolase superfamily enzyme
VGLARQTERSAGLAGGGSAPLRALTTAFTIGLGDEATTRRKARQARHYPLLKLKVDAERHIDVVQMVRQEHPGARIVVDANQSWSRGLLVDLLPALAHAGVELVEQPLPKGQTHSSMAWRRPCRWRPTSRAPTLRHSPPWPAATSSSTSSSTSVVA